MKHCKITIDAYERNVAAYVAHTAVVVGDAYRPFLDTFAQLVAFDPVILEVGSATGRDAAYLEAKGLSVVRSDVTQAFVDYLQTQGIAAVTFDVLVDNLHTKFSGVLAQAVFLHFTKQEFEMALGVVTRHLKPGGYFAFSVKSGVGEGYSDHKFGEPRYFTYWEVPELTQIVERADFTLIATFPPEDKWIQMIVQKI